ncbi:vitamin K-dependent protein C [Exaiptasia diaphana]|uniref:Gla domain-containing protein n=1 Tax=Exaiptasia diaphana TaxID=2652724 RepID=A0A913X1X7_EXADI|nr:vitamin K-dependent protein C [Exaiptasia diaphana]KXJ20735.1 hypothetical protein AC249_AIPGENE12271 [Exaiptasia diaphana]
MKNFIAAAFLLLTFAIVALASKPDNDEISLSPNQANDFNIMKRLKIAKRSLYHECYVEGCDYEEVEESYSNEESGEEYWKKYTCAKKGQNCPPKDPDCGSGREAEGAYSQRCRTSCRSGERRQWIHDNRCSGGRVCCQCHARTTRGCSVDL